jgi:hypothetical protein
MSVGCYGPFDADEEDPDSDYDRLAMSRRLKGRKQRLFSRQFGLLTHSQRRSCEWRAFEMICARTIKSGGGK